MTKSVSVDIHADHRPGHDFAKWGVHPTSLSGKGGITKYEGMASGGIT